MIKTNIGNLSSLNILMILNKEQKDEKMILRDIHIENIDITPDKLIKLYEFDYLEKLTIKNELLHIYYPLYTFSPKYSINNLNKLSYLELECHISNEFIKEVTTMKELKTLILKPTNKDLILTEEIINLNLDKIELYLDNYPDYLAKFYNIDFKFDNNINEIKNINLFYEDKGIVIINNIIELLSINNDVKYLTVINNTNNKIHIKIIDTIEYLRMKDVFVDKYPDNLKTLIMNIYITNKNKYINFDNLPNELEYFETNCHFKELYNLPHSLKTIKINSYNKDKIKLPYGTELTYY